uniref:Carbohydrate kinase PfkB domain-containing protein n=1 Tax=Romanomermis culicivorax TaxID=13658 RepID=A0A915JGK4_ROMCU
HVTTVDDSPTGTATVVVSEESGENFIIVNSGANAKLSMDDVDSCENMIKNSKVVVCQLEVRATVVRRAFEIARKFGVLTLFNPAPADAKIDGNLFDFVDILCINESEAQLFTNIAPKCPQSTKNCLASLRNIANREISNVILTAGSKGCYFTSRDGTVHHVPTSEVIPVDTTGAGDSFVGALAFYLSSLPDLPMREKPYSKVKNSRILVAGIRRQSATVGMVDRSFTLKT